MVEGGSRVAETHIADDVGDAAGGGEVEGGGAPHQADRHELLQGCPEEIVPLLVHLKEDWRQKGSLGGLESGLHPCRQG